MSQMHLIPVGSLNDFISAIFGHAGCEPEEAARSLNAPDRPEGRRSARRSPAAS